MTIKQINDMTGPELRDLYARLYGKAVKSTNPAWLRQQCAAGIKAQQAAKVRASRAERAADKVKAIDPVEACPKAPVAAASAGPTLVSTERRYEMSTSTVMAAVAKMPYATGHEPRAGKPFAHDPKIPAVGSRLVREWKGVTHLVVVAAHGFAYQGKIYRSLRALARIITGTVFYEGKLFFGVVKRAPGGRTARTPRTPKPSPAARYLAAAARYNAVAHLVNEQTGANWPEALGEVAPVGDSAMVKTAAARLRELARDLDLVTKLSAAA